jgi:hypothetical protein
MQRNHESEGQITLINDVGRLLLKYSVILIGVGGDADYGHCGCGTLVESGGYYILTAAHCASALDKYDSIGLCVANYEHKLVMPNQAPPILIRGRTFGEWGPDLAFLPIPNAIVETLKARQSFYNLDSRRQAEMLVGKADRGRGPWAIVGSPAATSALHHPLHEFDMRAFFVRQYSPHERDEFDYLDIPMLLNTEDQLPTFKGVSGGGLWQIDVARRDGRWDMAAAPTLEGCAFYEDQFDGCPFIRCHGRRSIYEHGLRVLHQQARLAP